MEHHASNRLRLFALLLPALLLTLRARDVVGHLKFNVPPDTVGGQLVINEGETLPMSCEDDDDSVKLTYPPFINESSHEIHKWNSSIVIDNVRPVYTGYYNCTSQSNPVRQLSMYVYVKSKSKERPWVIDSENATLRHMLTEVSVQVYNIATLDCRPNDPNTTVRLRDSKNHTMTPGFLPGGVELSWDPRVGFRLGPVETRHSGIYWCEAEGSSRDLQLKLQVVEVKIVEPMLRSNIESWPVPRGSDFILTCELTVVKSVKFTLTWSRPSGPSSEGYRFKELNEENESDTWRRRTATLRIFYVKNADAGDYTCTADDGKGTRRSTTYILRVQGALPATKEE